MNPTQPKPILATSVHTNGPVILDKKFESAEHDALEVPLPHLDSPYENLPLQNGAALPFTMIIALAGDYYAIPKKPICRGETVEDRRSRFIEAYQKLARSDRSELRNIMGIINEQAAVIKKAMAEGKTEHDAVTSFNFEEVLKATIDTKCHFLNVSRMNIDHFGENAIIAHSTGHTLAKMAAARAHYMKDETMKKKELAYAYSLEAFACHFLTDLFATGHIRTPRLELYLEFGANIGAVLSLLMHGEDNTAGLYVTNKRGDNWKAYGDGYLFEKYNQQTKDIILEALNIVVKEVDDAYMTGDARIEYPSAAYNLLPQPCGKNNTTPMFVNDAANAQLLYRTNLSDKYSTGMTPLTLSRVPCICAHFLGTFMGNSALGKKLQSIKNSVEAELKNGGYKLKSEVKKTSRSIGSFFCCSSRKTNAATPVSSTTPKIK